MPHGERPHTGLGVLLERVEAAPPAEALRAVEDALRRSVGAGNVSLLIADYRGRAVVRFDRSTPVAAATRPGGSGAEIVELPGTLYEQVLRSQRADVSTLDTGVRLTVPVTVRGDAIGLLELDLPSVPTADVLGEVASVSLALGYVVVTNRRYTDLFEQGQRTAPFSLAAEVQRRLLPGALTYAAAQFTVAGWLEPASTIGGDTFDYALDHDTLHVSITDAVGHDVNAALLATVLVGSLRNGRRRGMAVGEQARTANEALAAHSPAGQFVTGQLIRLDLRSGVMTIVNAGHPFPLLLRGDSVEEVTLDIDLPFGLYPDRSFRLQEVALQPGDRILLVTDGMLEPYGAEFDLPAILRRTARLHPRDVVHHLGDQVLLATGGRLRDDATALCLDWNGGAAPG